MKPDPFKPMKFIAEIQGGVGPDVWDAEVEISAVDIVDAAQQVAAKAEEARGIVVCVSVEY